MYSNSIDSNNWVMTSLMSSLAKFKFTMERRCGGCWLASPYMWLANYAWYSLEMLPVKFFKFRLMRCWQALNAIPQLHKCHTTFLNYIQRVGYVYWCHYWNKCSITWSFLLWFSSYSNTYSWNKCAYNRIANLQCSLKNFNVVKSHSS